MVGTFPIKQFQGKYCLSPFVMIEVTLNGDVRMCGCGAWMPTTIGNLTNTRLQDMLASELAQQIRQSIVDGSYGYCNEKFCGVIANNSLNDIDTVPDNIKALFDDVSKFEMPHHISFQGDETCNLSCPSCRTRVKKTPPEQTQAQQYVGKLISDNLFCQATDQKIKLEVSGTGEVFASPLLMNFINSINPVMFPNLELDIGTNGLMCEQNWHKLGAMQSAVKKITVSIDAAQPSTYQTIRRGGTWTEILQAMKFLQNKKHQQGFALHARMIVQQKNYLEIEQFYQLCRQFDVDVVEYSRLQNWGTWSGLEFRSHDVFDPAHSEHESACAEIAKIKQLSGTWFAGL
jgi:wyosine [tRNA(Phe)-imidazoG37] synthetase (radical SAM superfamily)